jgi:hypothetical protein
MAADPLMRRSNGEGWPAMTEREVQRQSDALQSHIDTRRLEWDFALKWAAELSDKDLRALRRISLVGDAALAADGEYGRRFGPFAAIAQTVKGGRQ